MKERHRENGARSEALGGISRGIKKDSSKRRVLRSGIGRVIAERILTVAGVNDEIITVSLGIPHRVDSDTWECPYSIEGLGSKRIARCAPGGDSLQALLVAVEGIRWCLMQSGETFEWDGDSLLGGDTGAIPRFLRIGMGKEFYERIEAAIKRETDATRKFRAPIMRRWLIEAGIPTSRSGRKD